MFDKLRKKAKIVFFSLAVLLRKYGYYWHFFLYKFKKILKAILLWKVFGKKAKKNANNTRTYSIIDFPYFFGPGCFSFSKWPKIGPHAALLRSKFELIASADHFVFRSPLLRILDFSPYHWVGDGNSDCEWVRP